MENRFSPISPWYRWYIFAICAIMYIASCFWRVSNAVVAGDLSRDLSLSPETLGLLGGAFFYSFGLVQLPMGPLFDRFGPRIVISLMACIGAISAVVFALAGNGATAILARAGIGIGMASVLMGSYKIFTTWFSPHKFATLSGSLISLGSLGAIGATTPLAWLSEAVGWRNACLYMAAITLLLAIAMYVVVRDRPPQQAGILPHISPPMSDIFSGLRTVFGSSLFWRLAPLGFTSYGTLICAQGLWGGPYLMHTYGMSKTAAGSILLAIPVGVICGAPLWGHWSDRLGRRKLPTLLVLGAMLLVFSSLALNLQLPRWGLVLQCWLLGLTGAGGFILYAQVKETFPLSIVGTALTALNFFIILGAAMLQHMMGIILDNWQPSITGALPVVAYQWGFGVCAAFLAMTLALYTISRDTGERSAHGLLQ
jgi:sugar phosphate permease